MRISLSESSMMMRAVDISKVTMGLKLSKFTDNVSPDSTTPSCRIVILTHCLVMESENGRPMTMPT